MLIIFFEVVMTGMLNLKLTWTEICMVDRERKIKIPIIITH